jgi:FKBP-type peptidyl-prolyl cis-trans isomerase FkpA
MNLPSRAARLALGFGLLFSAAIAAPVLAQNASAQTSASSIIPLPFNPIVGAPQRTCATKTSSGLGYTPLRQAVGAKPTDGDVVLLAYIGYLSADGAVFDQGQRAPLAVTDVIPGFTEGLKLMSRGAIYRVCIPAALGYGAKATGPIPANSDLVFQIELLDFKSRAEIEAMRKAQAGAGTGAPDPAKPGN